MHMNLRRWADRVCSWTSSLMRGLMARVLFVRIVILGEMFNIKSIISLCVYIAVIPLIVQLLGSLSTTLTGTAGTLVAAIIGLVPLILVVKVLDKLEF